MVGYAVPKRQARFEQAIKKSRFIGIATPVATVEDVRAARAAIETEFPDATHHCWAYVLGNPETSAEVRMDDGGEPSGTAGRPILSVLQHKHVGDVLLVVVRYFGGIKLGASGLVRAYSTTASGVMDALEVVVSAPMVKARLTLDYADEGPVRRLLDELDVTVSTSTYGERVELIVRVPEDRVEAVRNDVSDRTSGRAKLVAI